jgi:hypothetical protein
MYDTDLVILRILVDGPLITILAGVYSGSISPTDKVLITPAREMSDAAIHLWPSGLASTFTPIKTHLQAVVDRLCRDKEDPLRRPTDFSLQVGGGIRVADRRPVLEQQLEEAMAALNTVPGQATSVEGAAEQEVAPRGEGTGEARRSVTLPAVGRFQGPINLGPRRCEDAYEPADSRALTGAAKAFARVLMPPGSSL